MSKFLRIVQRADIRVKYSYLFVLIVHLRYAQTAVKNQRPKEKATHIQESDAVKKPAFVQIAPYVLEAIRPMMRRWASHLEQSCGSMRVASDYLYTWNTTLNPGLYFGCLGNSTAITAGAVMVMSIQGHLCIKWEPWLPHRKAEKSIQTIWKYSDIHSTGCYTVYIETKVRASRLFITIVKILQVQCKIVQWQFFRGKTFQENRPYKKETFFCLK